MKKSLKLFLIFTVIIQVLACGGNNNSGSTTPVSTPIDLAGKWAIDCYQKKIESYQISAKATLIGTITDYTDNNCKNGVQIHVSSATYTIGNKFTTTDGIVAYQMDIRWDLAWFGGDVQQLVYRDGDKLYFGVVKSRNLRPTQIDFNKALILIQ